MTQDVEFDLTTIVEGQDFRTALTAHCNADTFPEKIQIISPEKKFLFYALFSGGKDFLV